MHQPTTKESQVLSYLIPLVKKLLTTITENFSIEILKEDKNEILVTSPGFLLVCRLRPV